MPTQIQNNETILFFGDSITDCGRREAACKPFGRGYVNLFNDMLLTRDSEKNIRVVNCGISGHTVEDLRSRWSDDVLAYRPDWLVIMIGINDINQYLCKQGPVSLSPETYEEIYGQLLSSARAELPSCRLMLIEPFYGSLDTLPGSYRTKVAELFPCYLQAIARLAAKYGTLHLKMDEIFKAKFKVQSKNVYFPEEPVHPASPGHFLIAESVYAMLA